MGYQYKVIVSNKNIYKEFDLSADTTNIKLGTLPSCEFRLNSANFFEKINAMFEFKNGQWMVSCNEEIYFSRGDLRKLLSTELKHGDILSVRYADSGEEAFQLRFMIDFEARVPYYNWKINVRENGQIMIGDDSSCDLICKSQFCENFKIRLQNNYGKYIIEKIDARYGLYVNGLPIDDKKELSSYDFFSVAEFFFYLKNGELFFDMSGIQKSKLQVEQVNRHESGFRYPLFNRNTRVKVKINDEKISILDAPEIPKKPKQNIVQSLLPSVLMMVVVVFARGMMDSSSGSFIIMSVCSMSVGIVTSIVSFIYGQKDYKDEIFERRKQYNAYLDKKRAEIEKARKEERDTLHEVYYDINKDVEMGLSFHHSLFDRNMEDEDFLSVYLGNGAIEAKREIDNKKQDKLDIGDDLTSKPQELKEAYKFIQGAPISIDLKDDNAVGIVGDDDSLKDLFKNFVIDLSIRQYKSDVKIMALVENLEEYHWLKSWPHVWDDNKTRNIVSSNEGKNYIFENLYRELNNRSMQSQQTKKFDHHIVILVMDEFGIKNHPISRFINSAKDIGVTFVFFENKAEKLPENCGHIIELQGNFQGILLKTDDKLKQHRFQYQHIEDVVLENLSKKLAPIYCEEISLENSLTKNITLFELLHIFAASDLNLKQRWEKSEIYKSMAAPLGVNAKNEIVYLNLHEKAHGPHGLVAGTTGSGKSEILQSYIMSAASLFHPYEIGFVIIDFKGGGMANQFKNLPHLIGTITNIDGNEVQRSLKSIKAELVKRQAVFASAGVNHIDKYIRKYKNGEATVALPHLIIIVDEFAELKAEQPDFMKELISAARIGRSLGVHLILATQKPTGVVDAQIWSNSKFKLCLKVQSPEDSNEVLKTPLAAEIKEPGRAYLQVGNNEIFELFQSAYSGGSSDIDEGIGTKAFKIFELNDFGMRRVLYEKKPAKKENADSLSQLDAIVMYIAEYCKKNKIERLPNICMPPLPALITYDCDCGDIDFANGVIASIGLLDDPDRQAQENCVLNLSNQNIILIGSSQTGKTNFLQTIIRNLAENYSPEQLNMYVIDFGSMILKNFEELNHIGGVVCASDDEKLKNLFKLLENEMEDRKQKLAQSGVSSFASYIEAGFTDLPQILVLIDNMTPLKEMYLQQDDFFMPLLRDGVAVGMTFLITNSQTSGIGYRYLNNFEGRISLFCNDSSEYSSIIDGCRMKLPNIAGRALVKVGKEAFETQLYMAFEGEKEIERVSAIKEFISDINERHVGKHARRIPEIPETLTWEYVEQEYPNYVGKDRMILGLDYESILPVSLDMTNLPFLAIVGNAESKKKQFVHYFVQTLLDNRYFNTELYISDGMQKDFEQYKHSEKIAGYETAIDTSAEMILEIEARLDARYNAVSNGGMDAIADETWIVLLMDNRDVITEISNDNQTLEAFKNIISKYKNMKAFVLFTNVENENIAFNSSEVLKQIKNANTFLLFEDISNIKVCDLSISITKKFAKKIEPDDAYMILNNKISKLRTLTADEAVG